MEEKTVVNLPYNREAITCYDSDNLEVVIKKLKQNNIGALAVINSEKVGGVLSSPQPLSKNKQHKLITTMERNFLFIIRFLK